MPETLHAERMRIEYYKIAPEVSRALAGLDRQVGTGGLEDSLLDLVKVRAS